MSQTRTVRANGVELCVESFGSPMDPSILLIAGAASSMDWWEDEFCARLAAGGRFVVRYDHHDTGQSTSYAPGAPPYRGSDLVDDAVGLLDALKVQSAHLVGISMGGGIAMSLALDHPRRVDSLTLISTSTGSSEPDLPKMTKELKAYFARERPTPDWSDRRAVIDYTIEDLHAFTGRRGLDEQRSRELIGRVFDRTRSMAAGMNHWALEDGAPIRPRLGKIRVPTLVLHGTDDPMFPYGHGEVLAREIRGARLIPLEGVGHEMPPAAVWDVVIPAILSHTACTRLSFRGA
jgi:pimeloyl-ACP methyl ester carboxylesterase